ncbi:cyclic nucleotide-binding domain protein (macronuclear) [Tetrahymena thermophila SB210]|uniref:Cyclic nucleotide-binding domain protein n=1 Tax=Tetrahymena thermophila (strain SB210) TaxID=312017 RepID=Q23VB0_TETTS|nr:cyclic nucleotide-binding domain protein [Tetrahymena thermophila SB210]EAS00472.2 cyclic nucleotide-binding domain protein [Tetrahymena thermophila SB210]|eukprot:XP_001020717.2 cyclic nucleotide-binding domain protein [Tetrahymena thermophila SB210]
MSKSVLRISDDLIENQQFQKKRLTDQIEENTQLKKVCDHFEESCNSEIFTTYRQSNNIKDNTFNECQIHNSSREGKTSLQQDKVEQINKNSQMDQLITNSVVTTESFYVSKDKNQTKQKNNLHQNKHYTTVNDDRQMTFNDDSNRKSVQSSMRGSYIAKAQRKPDVKQDLSRTLQFKKDLLKLTQIRKKIMNFFYNKTIFGRTNLLKNNQIQSIINDLSDINDQINRTNSKRTCLELLQCVGESQFNFLKYIPPFNPQNSVVFFLSLLFCFLNYLFYILLSIDIIFDVHITQTFIQVGICLQIAEILIKLNTSVYIQTEYFSDRKVIFIKYFRDNLIYDVLPLFTLIIQFYIQNSLNLILKGISFIKIHNVGKEYKMIYEQICISAQKYYYLVQLTHLILSLFLLAHLIACSYYLIGLIEQNFLHIETWFSTGFTTDDPVWWKLYLEAINWSLTLMTTGSNVVYTPLQAFFTSFIMLFSTIIFGYFINIIGDILAQKDEEEQNQRKDINIINQYMRKRSINKDLQRVINLDIEYFYQKNYKKEEEQNQSVLDKLSINLKNQLQKEYFGRILSQFECIKINFSEETKEKLALQMQEAYFLPNQVIFSQENVDFNSLIFVIDGEIQLTKQSSNQTGSQVVDNIFSNQVFGTYSFFTGQAGDLQAKAITFTSIVKIQRDVFLSIIKDNEKDQQQFNLIKDNILLYNNYQLINISCSVCKNFKHLTSECPQVHFDKNEFQNKIKFYQNVKQKRASFDRKLIKSLNTLSQIKLITQYINNFEKIHFVSLDEDIQVLAESSSETDSDGRENEKQSDEQSLVLINQNDHRKSIIDSLIKEDKNTRKSKTIQDGDKNLKYLSLQYENAKEKSNQFLPRGSVLENLYEVSQADGINQRTSFRVHKKIQQQIRLKHDIQSFQNLNSLANVDAFTIIKLPYENPWLFEKQKDYQYYFPEGNLKIVLTQHNRVLRQKNKLLYKTIAFKKL